MKSMLLNGFLLAMTTLGGFGFASTPKAADANRCGGTVCCDKCPACCADCCGNEDCCGATCCGQCPTCCK
jgi:hypothetical protein